MPEECRGQLADTRYLAPLQIITFDPMGVTGHINHEGCYTGVR